MRKIITPAAVALALLTGTAAMAYAQQGGGGNLGEQDQVGNTSGPPLNSAAAGGIWAQRGCGAGPYCASGAVPDGYGAGAPAYGASPYGSPYTPYGPNGMTYGPGTWGAGR